MSFQGANLDREPSTICDIATDGGIAPLGDAVLGRTDDFDEMVDLHIAKRLRSRRRHLGLTQLQIGTQVGVRFQQIQKYECAANRIPASRLWRLAAAPQVNAGYFFEGLQITAPDPT